MHLRKKLLGFVLLTLFSPTGLPAADNLFSNSGVPACFSGSEEGGSSSEPHPGFGFDLGNLDKSATPCADFYQYACGGWMQKNSIPAAYPSWGSFSVLQDRNLEVLHQILEGAAKTISTSAGSNLQKIGSFYASCMDTAPIETAGAKPLDSDFARLASIKDIPALQAEIARFQGYGVNVMFRFGSTQDFKNTTQVIGDATQGGLGLPDRDYYTKEDAKSTQLRQEYLKHVSKMFELLGDSLERAAQEAKTVMDIETNLAKASMTRVQLRDPKAQYHKMDTAQLKELTLHFDWTQYFTEIGHRDMGAINVGQPDFFKEINRTLASVSLDDWKTYLRWHLIDAAAPALSEKFVAEDFHFKGTVLTGTKEMLPRWKRCVAATDQALGEALGQIYVEKNFPPAAKSSALEMVRNLEATLKNDLETLNWMDSATRQRALAKLNAYANKIGYPDKWRDYSALHVDRGVYFENVKRARFFSRAYNLGKIGKPVDRTEWGMTPPTVNAYYNPLMNEIVFPAGILQPPFYDPKADDAVNYGGMGAVIGHEMTHGFDDQGRQFDAQGNLKDWWTPEDAKKYEARAACVENQFSEYSPLPGVKVNGKLVLGESIADLGGLTIALAAYEKSIEGRPRTVIDGFTPEQRFFLGWAQVWCQNVRPEFARLLVNLDPHPPGHFRTIGPVSNIPAFSQAFGCKADASMVRLPDKECKIW